MASALQEQLLVEEKKIIHFSGFLDFINTYYSEKL